MTAKSDTSRRWLSIVGIGESGLEGLSQAAIHLVRSAELVVGGERHLALVGQVARDTLVWQRPFRSTIDRILERAGKPVCVLASGDPFWFGAGVALAERVALSEMVVLPAPSVFSLAAARLGWPLQSTVTLGLHTKRLEVLVRHLHHGQRIMALSLDGDTPRQAAALLETYGFGRSAFSVFENLGGPRERDHRSRADEITRVHFGPLNMMAIEVEAGPEARAIPYATGLPDAYFDHDGQITKREVRAITLSSLRPCPGELLWDVGLGSGSVAIEWLLSHSRMRAIGFEEQPERIRRALGNAISLGVPHLEIVEGRAPNSFTNVEPPDAIFVGGGAGEIDLLHAAWMALKPGGRMVCNAVTLGGQASVATMRETCGGSLTRICIEREHEVGRHLTLKPAIPVLQWTANKPRR